MRTPAEIVESFRTAEKHEDSVTWYLDPSHDAFHLLLLRREHFDKEGLMEVLKKIVEVDKRFEGEIVKP